LSPARFSVGGARIQFMKMPFAGFYVLWKY
jgi:hypothetical protein